MTDINVQTLNTNEVFKILGAASSDNAGQAVSGAGDINGDGIPDVIIGAPQADPNGRTDAGTAYVIYGKAGGLAADIDLANLTPDQGFKILGAASNDHFGTSVSGAGDLNNDGIPDVIIGADQADPSGRSNAGTAYVIYGKAGGLADIDIVNLTPDQGFKILGSKSGDKAGISVSSAGDINKDGIPDAIIGANQADPSGRSNAGMAYVIYGKAGGSADIDLLNLTSAQGFKILGAASNDNFGTSVGSAGDLNGDKIADIIIGAPNADPSGRTNAGTSYVIYGRVGGMADLDLVGLTPAQGFKIPGSASSDNSGSSVSGVGDINNDGIDDAIIVAPQASSGAGRSYVIYGNAGGLVNTAGFSILGAVRSVSSADINNDGIPDIILGVPGYSYGVYVVYGKAGGSADIDLTNLTPAQGYKIFGGDYQFGYSVSAGDITGDGMLDLIIGDPSSTSSAGTTRIIYTRTSLVGTTGDDILFSSIKCEDVDGLSGIDTISYANSTSGVNVNLSTNTLSAGFAQCDTIVNIENIVGSAFDDTLTGSSGDNIIQGGPGADTLNGGAGVDTLSYSDSTSGVNVNLTSGTAAGGDATDDRFTNFENLRGSDHTDTLTGDANPNTIQGGAGDDVMEGKAGADTLDGGAGTDTVSYASSAAGVTVSLTSGTGTGGDAEGDGISNVENILGSNFSDTLTGDANPNTIQGGAGDDTIEGKAGADRLDGGAGIDTLSYASSAAGVTVSLTSGTGSAGDATGDKISNFENVIGSDHDDTIAGDANPNNIQGGAGNDTIDSGAGLDIVDGGSGIDTISYGSASSAVYVDLSLNLGANDSTLTSIENIKGSGYSDTLIGNNLSNTIDGGAGDDILQDGGGGNDSFTGGLGNDTFIITNTGGIVTINDFKIQGGDQLDVGAFNKQYTDIFNASQDRNGNCEITLNSKRIILVGVSKSSMDPSWFGMQTIAPTPVPTPMPTPVPTPMPSVDPNPTPQPTPMPSVDPSPTPQPTPAPSVIPSANTTTQPTPMPSVDPNPTPQPTPMPSEGPNITKHDVNIHKSPWLTSTNIGIASAVGVGVAAIIGIACRYYYKKKQMDNLHSHHHHLGNELPVVVEMPDTPAPTTVHDTTGESFDLDNMDGFTSKMDAPGDQNNLVGVTVHHPG
jgi:Ca2+-binding RTX toxin-like protein